MPQLTPTHTPLPHPRLPYLPPPRLKPRINLLPTATIILLLRTATHDTTSPPTRPRHPPAPAALQLGVQASAIPVMQDAPSVEALGVPDAEAELAEVAEGEGAIFLERGGGGPESIVRPTRERKEVLPSCVGTSRRFGALWREDVGFAVAALTLVVHAAFEVHFVKGGDNEFVGVTEEFLEGCDARADGSVTDVVVEGDKALGEQLGFRPVYGAHPLHLVYRIDRFRQSIWVQSVTYHVHFWVSRRSFEELRKVVVYAF